VIADVGPGGHFLSQKHTRRHLREIWIPSLTQPRPLPGGESLPDIRQRARAEFDRILAEHEPEPLEEAAQAELRAVLKAATRELGA
jgi:trimethylamine--corrinoid protein Co-methyltransferase